MTDKLFWKTISDMNWNKDFNYNRINNELKNNFYGNDVFVKELTSKYYEKLKLLSKKTNSLSKKDYSKYIDLSDDELSDLLAQIIANGEDNYNEILEDISKISSHKDFYQESFTYSFLN